MRLFSHSCPVKYLLGLLTAVCVLLALTGSPAFAQTPPNPTPDPTAPNVYYGAVPSNASQAPLLIFIHGLNGKASDWWTSNDMYSDAYAAGYRTAFVSLSPDNSPNTTSWQQNGITLKPLLTKIASHYNAQQFYLVCHSKGGLDAQAALLNSTYTALDSSIEPMVKAMFMLATPNQGTALADWAYGPGQTLAQQYGLLSSGLQSLEVATVQGFRAQADPVFTQSQLQFYTFAGDTSQGNALLQYTGGILSGLTPGLNDGFLTVANAVLPNAYSMNIGEIAANHFQMNLGHVSFPAVDGIIQGLERQMSGFQRLATGGLGDDNNTWAWSLKWFQGKLYLGTGRQVSCVTFAGMDAKHGTHLYPPANSGCPSDPKDLSLGAEIWQYAPQTHTWTRVFQSPSNISIGNDSSGNSVSTARDIAFRSMIVFTESDGTQALYVAGASSGDLFSSIAPYDTQGYPPPRILRSTDGVNFTPIPQDPGTFLGNITQSDPSHPVYAFRSLVAYNGMLFAVASDYRGSGIIVGSAHPGAGDNAWFQASPSASDFPVWSLNVFANHLWAIGGSGSNQGGYFAAYTDAQGQAPFSFTNVLRQGGSSSAGGRQPAISSIVFQNHLYIGTGWPTELVRINSNLTWDLVTGAPRNSAQGQKNPLSGIDEAFDNQFNAYFLGMGVVPAGPHQGLYLGTWDLSSELQAVPPLGDMAVPNFGADLMQTADSVHWNAVTTTGFGDGLNYALPAIESTPLGTFIGTARSTGGFQIWLDQTILDLNGDGVIDRSDLAIVQAAVGQPATQPYDRRDVNQDGQITAQDVQLLGTQCTYPGCSSAPNPLPAAPAAPANLTADPKSASSTNVRLNWNAVPGAVAYRVYRQTQTPLLKLFPPQGVQVTVLKFHLTIPQDILSGKLDFLCPAGATSANPICAIVNIFKQASQPGSTIGFPAALVRVARTAATTYQETAPTPLQSIYFVRAEDTSGNLSEPSNVVGAPSEAGSSVPPPPTLTVSPGSLSFSITAGSSSVPPQQIQIGSTGAQLGFTAAASVTSPSGGKWLQVAPASGTAPASPGTTPLAVTVNPSGLAAGSYAGSVTVTDPSGNSQQIAVTFTVSSSSQSSLVLSAKSLSFTYQIGGGTPATQHPTVASSGAPISFKTSASVSTPKGGGWLQVSPSNGTAPSSPNSLPLNVSVTVNGLSTGTYNGTVTVLDTASLHPQTISVTLSITQSTKPPVAPPPTVDPTQPNLFYGAIPPNGPNGPVVVFVHGLGGTYKDWLDVTGNDMYDLAYQAGFRTAFMSLNLDNSPNNADIPTNAAMLQTMFPKILAHFGATKLYFVCHSKGGLDLEAAIATPQWIGLANAVITLGTPNQGDALADWLFSSAGQSIGQTLGLLTPGVQALETANVLSLRTQWDPVFQQAHIPFYTLSGNTFACPTSQTCSTSITGPILQSLTGGSSAPYNDGLVDHPETLLPTSYAMELGVIHCNHYQLRLGDNSFPYVYARVIAQDNEQPGFSMVATGGFGDQHNTWAWSSAWFKGKLYVGTGRETYCVTSATAAIKLGIPSLYPPSIGDCTPDYHYLPLQAEIWQYDPTTQTWSRVYQSPNSLTTTDSQGNTVATARDIGFRGMTVVNEPDGTQALYAGGVTSGEIFETTPGTWAPPRVMRSVDGVNWNSLPQHPGGFLGQLTANGTSQYPNYSVRSASQLNGVLFLQVGDFPGVGRVISSVPGVNPALGDDCGLPACFEWASPPTAQLPVWILENFNNFLYAGTGNPPGAGPAAYGVWKTDGKGAAPYTWTEIVSNGGWAQGLVADYAMSLQIYSDPAGCPGIGCLYVGTDRPNELVRVHPNDTWDLVVGNPRTVPAGQPNAGKLIQPLSGIGQYFNNGFTGHFWRMGVGGQGMYMGTWDWSADQAQQPTFAPLWAQEFGTDLWRTTDGIRWYMASKIGLGDGNNTGSRSFSATPFGLYMGTARSIGGTQVFQVDNSVLDFNHDGVIDQNDVALMSARVGTPAQQICPATIMVCNDPMDLNQDGQITSADVDLLMTQCTNPACAVPPVLPPYATLPAPILYSAPGSLGGKVTLSWNSIAGAKDYLVYRIALSPSQTTPPPSQLQAACSGAAASSICSQLPAAQGGPSNTAFGYPGPPVLLTRVTNPSFTEGSLSTLQSLYFIRTEDSNGNLSAPSNIVGGPSLAAPLNNPPASVSVSSVSLTFSAQAGGAPTAVQNIQVSSTAEPLFFTASTAVTTPSGGKWLHVSPSTATAPSTPFTTPVSVSADPTGLIPGTYAATVTITDELQHARQVQVSFKVTASSGSGGPLTVSPGALAFSYQIGGTLPAAQSLSVSAAGAAANFTASAAVNQPAGGNWLKVTPTFGAATISPSATLLAVSVNPASLVAGHYTGTVFVVDPANNPHPVSVTLDVTGGQSSAFQVSSNSLVFNYQIGSGAPVPQTLSLSTAGAPLSFTAAVSVLPSIGGNWLSVSPLSGSAPTSPSVTTLTVAVKATTMPPGAYSGSITIAGGTGAPQQVNVTLLVSPPTPAGNGQSAFIVNATAFGFVYNPGGTAPAWLPLLIGSTGAPLPFTVASDSPWLVTDLNSGTTPAFPGATIIHVGVNPAGLALGTYSGTLTIAATAAGAGGPQKIAVNLTVTTDTSSSAGSPPDTASPRIIPHLANGIGWTTTILLVNTGSQPEQFTLTFWNPVGAPLVLPLGTDGTASSIAGTIQPGDLRVIQTDGSGGALAQGWATLAAPADIGGNVIFTAQANGQPPSAAAVPFLSAGSTTLYVPFDQTSGQYSFSTGLALANPGTSNATASVAFVDEFGNAIPASGSIAVPAFGHYAGVLGDLYPQIRGKRGVMQITANTALYGMGIRFNGAAFTSIDALASGSVPATPKVITQLANGQGWKTTILLVNTDTKPAPFTLNFWNQDGMPLTLPLGPDGNAPIVTGTIAPGNIRIIQTDGSGSALSQGWASLNTSAAIGGTAIFTAQSNGQPPSEAGVPLSAGSTPNFYMPFDNTSGSLTFSTGVALTNPNMQAASVSVTFTDDSGNVIPSTGTITVPGHGHYAGVLSTLFPATQGKRGAVRFSSSTELYGVGIRYNGGAYTSIQTVLPNSQ